MTSSHLSNQSLQWTRPLLDELCEQVRQAVESFGDEDTERREDDLDSAVEACEKVAGSLAVMEFVSGQRIAEAMGLALDALRQGEAHDENACISSVLEATAILPDYLDYLESTQRDAPMVVLPTINDLRAAAGAKLLDEGVFFRPELDSVELPAANNPTTATPAEMRRVYQHALRGLLLNNQDSEAMQQLAEVALQVRDLAALPDPIRRAAWAGAAVYEGLKEQQIASGPSITRLFARMDVMLKEASEGGDPEQLASKADDLARGFLFQIAMARAESPLAVEVHEAFALAEHAPDQMTQAKVFLAGRNRALFAAVTLAAREDLARIKEALGNQLEREKDPEVMQHQTAMLESVGESLAMLGLDHLAAKVKAQAGKLAELGTDPEDPILLMVARELLVVESQLEESFGLAAGLDSDSDSEKAGATLLPPSERRRVVKQLVKEALEDLAHSKHLLDAINRQKADAGAVVEAKAILDRIAGALSMSELDEAAAMINAAGRIAVDHLSSGPTAADGEALETLAETLTVTEFYLESLTTLDERGDRYLHSARERLTKLGYWLTDAPGGSAEAVDQAPVEATAVEQPASSHTNSEDEYGIDELETLEASGERLDDDEELDFDTDDLVVDELDLSDADLNFDELDADQEQTQVEPGKPISSDHEQASGEEPEPEADGEPAEIETAEVSSVDADGSAFDDFDIVEIFLEEFDQELESLEALLPKWRDQPANEEHIITIRRAFHSLKGSGRMAGATEISEFSWHFENLVNRVIDHQIEASAEVISLVADAVAALPSMRARLSGDGDGDFSAQQCSALAERADLASEGKLVVEPSEEYQPPELEDLDPTLIELMIKELSENLDAMNEWLAGSEEAGHAAFVDERLVRAVHTMKGTMRLAPIGDESETAQILEAYLEELSLCGASPSEAGLEAMSHCAELFQQRLDRLRCERVADDQFATSSLASELRDLHNKAHRDRTSEQSTDYAKASAFYHADDASETRGEADGDDAFSSDLATETDAAETDRADIDFFEVADEEVAAPASEEAGTDGEVEDVSEDTAETVAESIDETPADERIDDQTDDQTDDQIDDQIDDNIGDRLESGQPSEDEVAASEHDEAVVDELESVTEETSDADESTDKTDTDDELFLEEELVADDDAADFVPDRASGIHDDQDRTDKQAGELVHVDYSEINEELLEAFLEEGQELLEHADGLLQKWREAPDDKSLITALQRDLHTVKGSSRMVGLNPLGQVAHVMEELLEGIAAGLIKVTPERIDALEAGCDHLHSMVDAVLKREPMPGQPVEAIFAEEAQEIEDSVIVPREAAEIDDTTAEPGQTGRVENLRVPSALIDELVNYAGEISIFRSRLEQQISVFRNNVGEVDETVIRLRDQLRKLEMETEAQILARYEREHGPTDETFDPLELDRYSTIQQLSRALAESVNDLTSLTGILDDATRQSETLLMQQSRVNTELQEGLMQARMVSFNTLLPRFRRVIRNAGRELGKKVELRVDLSGESELDRNILDRITAPMEHLLRNAVSHGIELPEDRLALGKPETGTVSIEVGREATELDMRVFDDGAGLDLEAIRARAIERGLIRTNEEVSEKGLTQVIFRPGFTTADQVSELSGRGIGMDVVANEVRQIGGSVSASTEAGKGARFTIRIPLSLTVMQAIMVRAGDRHFSIPLQAVRGVTRILASEWLREIEGTDPHQDYAGDEFPLLELEPQLDFASEEVGSGTLSLLMIEAGDQRAALRVSELLGHREIVIKPVGPQISSIPGILGGTITGDGQVVPILDMGPLIRRAFELNIIPGQGAIREAERVQEVKRTPLVMVVDDSITMRRVTSRVLEHRGLEVVTARDGLDAVETMFDRIPDIILLDIEMPRMDGYELATHVRNDPRLKDIPMMMITSRSGEKHRQRAREIGVNDYLAKPYQEAELVAHVFDLLKMATPEG
ncbi:MAG: Hpt domain-containing protein [Wenzhouxiangella sp.]